MSEFYVSTSGSSSGNGTIESPWDLQTALNQPASVHPGDTIWMRGGTYSPSTAAIPGFTNYYSILSGTSGQPIIIRNYSGERAIIDGALPDPTISTLWIRGQYVWYWGLEVINSNGSRVGGLYDNLLGDTIGLQSPGSKLINLIIHDGGDGIGSWSTWDSGGNPIPNNSEVYGCIIYYSGWQNPYRGSCHGIYAQNNLGTSTLKHNIVFKTYGNGLNLYGSDAAFCNNMNVIENDVFDAGILSSGGGTQHIFLDPGAESAQNAVITGNTVYSSIPLDDSGLPLYQSEQAMELGWYRAGVTDAILTNNYLYSNCAGIELNNLSGAGITFADFSGNVIAGNNRLVYGDNMTYDASGSNTLITTKPTTNYVVVRPNVYEPGRANIAIFNWQQLSSVPVDISFVGLAVGQSFQVIDVQNPFGGPILTSTYTGALVSLPMTLTNVVQPIGNPPMPAVHTDIEFGAFVVLPGALSGDILRHTNYRLKIASAVTGSY